MRSQPEKQPIAINILPNILRSKGNQIIKFRQFIERDIRKIFVEKLYTKLGLEASLRPFSEKSKIEHISG